MESTNGGLMALNGQIKSKERVSTHGEVFTADREVNAMLNLVKPETERIDSRFLEPACGNGNFLVKILERKLSVVQKRYAHNRVEYEQTSLMAVGSLYGIEIQMDNVKECRERLYLVFCKVYEALFSKEISGDFLKSVMYVLSRNILWGDALTLMTPDGKAPIVFSEWTLIGKNGWMKRRDFELDMLLKNQPIEEPNLFSDLGEEAFIPTPLREYPVINYTQIFTQDGREL